MKVWKECFWCRNNRDLDHPRDGCPFCGGSGGDEITIEQAQKEILERELNKRA